MPVGRQPEGEVEQPRRLGRIVDIASRGPRHGLALSCGSEAWTSPAGRRSASAIGQLQHADRLARGLLDPQPAQQIGGDGDAIGRRSAQIVERRIIARQRLGRRLDVASFQGWPVSAVSACGARAGMPAMPPNAIRACVTMPSATSIEKAPHTAEISLSKRFDSLTMRISVAGAGRGNVTLSTNSPGARSCTP
jgi:hypothetical protein